MAEKLGDHFQQHKSIKQKSINQSGKVTVPKDVPVAIYEVDLSTLKFKWINQYVSLLLGFSETELLTLKISDLLCDKSKEAFQEKLEQTLSLKQTYFNSEVQVKTKNGSSLWGLFSSKVLLNDGKPSSVLVFAQDITERKKAEEALKENERLYRTVFDNNEDGFELLELICDETGKATDERILRVNSAFERYTGLKASEMVGKKISEINPNRETYWSEAHIRVLRSGKPEHIEAYVNFTQRYYDAFIFPYSARTVGIIFRDISERKKAEAKLLESEYRYRMIAENVQDVLTVVDEKGIFTFVSPSIQKALGYTPEELTGTNCRSLFHPDDVEAVIYPAIQLLREGKQFKPIEYRGKTKTGLYVWFEGNAKIMKDKNGKLGLLVIARNIEERKKAEQSLKEKKKELNCILDSTPTIIFYKDKQGKIIQANKALAQALNASKEDLLGKTVFDLYSPEIAQQMTNDDFEVMKSKTPKIGTIEAYESPTGLRWIKTDKIPSFNEKGEIDGIIGFSEEITERKIAEEAIKESEEKYRNLVNKLPEMVFEINVKGQVVFANSTALQTLGYTKDELENNFDANRFVAPEYVDLSKKNMKTMFEGGMRRSNEYVFVRKDGTNLPVLLTSSPIIRDNKIVGARGIVVDLTERKKMEMQLEEKERLAAIGATARMVGHDIRNPLQSMIGDIYLLKTDLENMPESQMKKNAEESFESIEKNILYINKIVADLQDYAKPLKPEYKTFKFSDILVSVFDSVYTPDSINISLDIEKCPIITSDPEFVRRAVTNLVTNAIQAMPDGGSLGISVFKKDRNVLITVSDTGVGIPKEMQARLFTPMWTTKARGQGLGLAVVKRLVEGLNGQVSFESEEGKGTKFIIELPTTQ